MEYIQQLLTSPKSLILELGAYLYGLFANFTTSNAPVNAPAAIISKPYKSRIRLDNDASATFTLPDGRKLGYAQYGSLTGRAFFYLHGHPGSRMEAAWFEELCLKLGARIIGVDRPGIGWSSPHPGGTLLDHPKDIEHLAQHLELDSYGILGMSGGGPYALACASSLPPEKLKCVSIVCGLGPPDIGMRGAGLPQWLGFTLGYPYAPSFVLKWWWQREPAGRLDLTDEERLEILVQHISKSKASANKKDLEVMDEDVLRMSLRSARECFSHGYDAAVQDGRLMSTEWGFRIEDIRPDLPVQLWYGKQDSSVPLNHGEQIAVRLGGRAHLRVEDETHASLQIKYQEEILENLIRSL
ncbi:alpha/beta-hydrolase [Lepidopterella palustris CBS 459.81]|uniref:Alpha/beta-hydrolase n=1 Tax=Lepidopterella palustris CBS 459.81 TaxID=1314670 RepID=A0A8E2E1V5_9PEZI|nr:alpha/beta-hydrolase [Lepidopterella palustris CBS 459.81]